MRIIIKKNYSDLSTCCTEILIRKFKTLLAQQDYVTWIPSAGATPKLTYQLLATAYQDNIDWQRIIVLQMDEYLDLSANDKKSFAHFLNTNLIQKLKIKKYFFLDTQKAKTNTTYLDEYENTIKSLGGIDVALHGIGRNAHIGFNEPDSDFNSSARIVSLASSTLQSNQVNFDENTIPKNGVTLGLDLLSQAKQNIIIASGEKKAQAVKNILAHDNDKRYPATILKSENTVFIVDQAAYQLMKSLSPAKPPHKDLVLDNRLRS